MERYLKDIIIIFVLVNLRESFEHSYSMRVDTKDAHSVLLNFVDNIRFRLNVSISSSAPSVL